MDRLGHVKCVKFNTNFSIVFYYRCYYYYYRIFLIFYHRIFCKLVTIDNMRNMRVSSDVECHCCNFSDAQQAFLILMQIMEELW